jgi:hypothetical protein
LIVAFGVGLLGLSDEAAVGWAAELVGGIAMFGLVLPGLGVFVPLWFPTGRPISPSWRWPGVAAVLGVVGIIGGWAVIVYLEGGDAYEIDACISVGTCANIIGLVLVLLGVVGAVVSLVIRWIRSRGVERLQMKWLVLAFFVFLIGVLAEFGGFQNSVVANFFLSTGLFLIPATIAIAVLRYRLYEIDRILSRTVTYAIVIILLGAVYLAGLAALTSLLSPESPVAVAGSTLAAAALFNPLRRRIQGWVDRRFNRSRYDTEKVMELFTESLRDRVDGDELVSGWVGVVSETMQPVVAGVWVRGSR